MSLKESANELFSVPKGASIGLRLVVITFRLVYVLVRLILRIVMGKKRRDLFLKNHYLYFSADFTFMLAKIFGFDKRAIFRIRNLQDQYVTYIRLNHDDWHLITEHEEAIRPRFSPEHSGVVIDVGANIGKYTLIVSKKVGEEGKVIAIEPHPGNFKVLLKNIQRNSLKNVVPINAAAYDRQTKVKLYITDKQDRSGSHSIAIKRSQEYIEVGTVTLDDLVNSLGIKKVNWIKIDVEGAEFSVITGAQNILRSNKDLRLLIENHSTETRHKIIEFLKPFGFNIDFDQQYDDGGSHVIMSRR